MINKTNWLVTAAAELRIQNVSKQRQTDKVFSHQILDLNTKCKLELFLKHWNNFDQMLHLLSLSRQRPEIHICKYSRFTPTVTNHTTADNMANDRHQTQPSQHGYQFRNIFGHKQQITAGYSITLLTYQQSHISKAMPPIMSLISMYRYQWRTYGTGVQFISVLQFVGQCCPLVAAGGTNPNLSVKSPLPHKPSSHIYCSIVLAKLNVLNAMTHCYILAAFPGLAC